MPVRLDAIRECFEGVIPATMATASNDGTPNVAYLSQVHFIDNAHVALSYQFFNKTRQNIMANPYATLCLTNPSTMAQHRLSLAYLRTETSGPLFESMKAKLAGIASHSGMAGVFRLLGADVYRVDAIEAVPGAALSAPPATHNLLAALRACHERMSSCTDLESLLAESLACLQQYFSIDQAMVLMVDAPGERLYTIASRGYENSGVGSEIPVGHGVIGVAARERTPIRIGHMNAEYAYGRAVRQSAKDSAWADGLETEIPLPGLPESRSQLAVPIMASQRLLGVLYVESPQDLRFTYDNEDALVCLAGLLGMAIHAVQNASEAQEEVQVDQAAAHQPSGVPLIVRRYPENDSVFLGDDYLIKGVAGSIFWVLLSDFIEKRRTEFSNRELRLDQRIRLPDVSDNLEARLILLSKRLLERAAPVRIEKTGRGRFRLCVDRPIQLRSS